MDLLVKGLGFRNNVPKTLLVRRLILNFKDRNFRDNALSDRGTIKLFDTLVRGMSFRTSCRDKVLFPGDIGVRGAV
jgi:hypothetical protein